MVGWELGFFARWGSGDFCRMGERRCGKRKRQYSVRALEEKMATIETFPGAIVRHISLSLHTRYMWPPHQIQIKTYLQRQIYISPHQMYLLTSSHTNSVLVGWLVVRLLRNKLENTDQRLRCFLSLFILAIAFSSENPMLQYHPKTIHYQQIPSNTIQYIQ